MGSPEPLGEAAVGGGGRVYLFPGPLAFPLDASAAAATLIGEGALGLAGSAMDLGGDLDGDSLPDVLVGAPAEEVGGGALGRAYLLSGRQSGSVRMADSAVGSLIGEGALGVAPQVGSSVGLLPARTGASARLLIGAAGAGQAFLLDPNPGSACSRPAPPGPGSPRESTKARSSGPRPPPRRPGACSTWGWTPMTSPGSAGP